MLALREHDEETAGIVHWDFNDERECGGMALFALVRIFKLIELSFRLTSSCRAAFTGRPRAMVCTDVLVVLMATLLSLVGASAACQENRQFAWYQDSYGRCNWSVMFSIFWISFLEVVFALGDRAAFTSGGVSEWNSFRRWACLKRCDPCTAYYSWQMFILNTLLDLFAALVLLSSGCHFGFMSLVAGPCGALGRWYAFGASADAARTEGFELQKLERGQGSSDARSGGRGDAGAAQGVEVDSDHLAVSPVRAQAQYRQRDT